MTEPSKADAPVDVPEADLLEQQVPWQNSPEEALIGSDLETLTDRTADEGDLLEQAQLAAQGPDDDDHPYGAPS